MRNNHRSWVPVLLVVALVSGGGAPTAEEGAAYCSHWQAHAAVTHGALVRACAAVWIPNC